jgi:hypothetical protein
LKGPTERAFGIKAGSLTSAISKAEKPQDQRENSRQ